MPPPALVSLIPVTWEPVGIFALVKGEPISGAGPSNGIIVLLTAISNSAIIVPELPLLTTSNTGPPIVAPV